ncbi:hypothetical protein BABINDRAFT_172841 [Babjeviella inositovora NRRL Y-12698]|uniref:Mitochondrial carrier protein n=1 Tax=Babjeviella inositovora NRRL Y-12698 TaxID=984486 RepID=A0A1E3QIK7_9ASCO|nr:uncharacterized protein BABINDRAFT_172841 [Babjeviella inositovora NRRL Y-12698]ODQ77531.1 hypothetical protein BABINDRAFT_172841 [Babjeviella inositovora NRRL Y-12698]
MSEKDFHQEYTAPKSALRLTPAKVTALSGALAGFLSGVAVCPLDVAKTRLQAQGAFASLLRSADARGTPPPFKYKGLVQTISLILKEEGIRGLYRGLVPIVFGYLPTWMIYFTVYEKCKPVISRNLDHEFGSYVLSAICAGAASSILTNPIWVVKTRLMLQTGSGSLMNPTFDPKIKSRASHYYYKGTIDAFRKMYKYEGLTVFYSGLVPSLFGLMHVGLQFPVYEKLKKFLRVDQEDSDVTGSRLWKLVAASSLSKMFASSITYPHEVLRTRMQLSGNTKEDPKDVKVYGKGGKKLGLFATMKNIYVKELMRGFYSGFVVNLMRTVPASAVTLVSFEYFKAHFTQYV